MKIVVVGLNHKTAPVDVRERLAFSAEQVDPVLKRFKEQFPAAEFSLLSTCNRTEIYSAAPREGAFSPDDVLAFFSETGQIPLEDVKKIVYVHQDQEAVKHLLNVSASLDSLVIGEPQIIAQVKECYRLAGLSQTTGKVLNRLFHCAFATSKEIYTITSISQRRVSVAGVAVELARQLFEDITAAHVAVIGAGEMGELLVRHLLDLKCKNLTVFNRTRSRAETMAESFQINAGDWQDLAAFLRTADIVIAAALAEEYLFDKSYLKGRTGGPLLIIDIAVPRVFDPEIDKLNDVYLYSVDDLAQVAQENIDARREDIGQAEEIIIDNVDSFMDWFGVMDIGPSIGRLRQKFHQISRAELERFFVGEQNMTTMQKQKMEAMTNRIVNKLLHRLINNFHSVAKTYGHQEANHLIESIIKYTDRM